MRRERFLGASDAKDDAGGVVVRDGNHAGHVQVAADGGVSVGGDGSAHAQTLGNAHAPATTSAPTPVLVHSVLLAMETRKRDNEPSTSVSVDVQHVCDDQSALDGGVASDGQSLGEHGRALNDEVSDEDVAGLERTADGCGRARKRSADGGGAGYLGVSADEARRP